MNVVASIVDPATCWPHSVLRPQHARRVSEGGKDLEKESVILGVGTMGGGVHPATGFIIVIVFLLYYTGPSPDIAGKVLEVLRSQSCYS